MKVLMIYCTKFGVKPTIKTIDFAPERKEEEVYYDVQTAFVQIEEEDMEKEKSQLKKFVYFVRWLARKNDCKKIVLHSFNHLSDSKATPEFAFNFFNQAQEKLERADYDVWQTPFGYFVDLTVEASGFSLARVFKSL